VRAEGVEMADVNERERQRAGPHRPDQGPDARMAARAQTTAPAGGGRLTSLGAQVGHGSAVAPGGAAPGRAAPRGAAP
jgi:hypothetical protein